MKDKIIKEVLKNNPILFYTTNEEEGLIPCMRCGVKVRVLKTSEHICITCAIKDYMDLTFQKTQEQMIEKIEDLMIKKSVYEWNKISKELKQLIKGKEG